MTGALSAFYHDSTIFDPQQRMIASRRLIAKMPTLAAMAYKYSLGQPFNYPRNNLTYAENFLYMCFAGPAEEYVIDPVLADAMDKILICTDHEQNASTSTVRLAGSSGAIHTLYRCRHCLIGGLRSGANEAVLNMLNEIGHKKTFLNILKKRDRNDPFRLFGFGHRVYKILTHVPKCCAKPVMKCSANWAFMTASGAGSGLERIAIEDRCFIEKKLYPNVDFYSGIILKAMGFPTSMFTVLFAVRTTGWIAQWNEMIKDPAQRIGRPRQHTGPSSVPS